MVNITEESSMKNQADYLVRNQLDTTYKNPANQPKHLHHDHCCHVEIRE
jgi:hypothetical protein